MGKYIGNMDIFGVWLMKRNILKVVFLDYLLEMLMEGC